MKLNTLEPGIKFPSNDFLLVKSSKHLVIEDKNKQKKNNHSHLETKVEEFNDNDINEPNLLKKLKK